MHLALSFSSKVMARIKVWRSFGGDGPQHAARSSVLITAQGTPGTNNMRSFLVKTE